MSKIGHGYGSEWHLLRYLGYHRNELDGRIAQVIGGQVLEWLDFKFNADKPFLDAEWMGLDFLEKGHPAKAQWRRFWPQKGNVPNWDAVGRVQCGDKVEWLLVEAKAHTEEIRSTCSAKKEGGLGKIQAAFAQTKRAMDVSDSADWLSPYYQYANRLAALHFLTAQGIPAKLLFIYFLGDRNPPKTCPKSQGEWQAAIAPMYNHLGLTGKSEVERQTHRLFLPVCRN